MAKPKNISLEGKEYFGWYYEEQTKVKHRVLGAYARIWISKLGCYSDTMFFDCHAGCGAYIDKNNGEVTYGSSFIIEKIADEINSKRSHKNYICTCEIDPKYYDNFKKINEEIGKKTISLKNNDFQDVLEEPKVKKYYSQHPTLFFVDPFGYTMKMSSIAKMMKNTKNEVFINFMFDFINRFLNVTDKNILNDFFGTTEWENANGLSNDQREKFLIELYKRKLKEFTKAKYVYAYKLCYADKDQTYYYLVHATNNIQGITYMKESFASVNNGRVEYLGKNNNCLSFFDLSVCKADEMYHSLLQKYKGNSFSFEGLWEMIAEETPYTSKDLNEIITELEKENKVQVTRVSSKRCSYKEQDIVKVI